MFISLHFAVAVGVRTAGSGEYRQGQTSFPLLVVEAHQHRPSMARNQKIFTWLVMSFCFPPTIRKGLRRSNLTSLCVCLSIYPHTEFIPIWETPFTPTMTALVVNQPCLFRICFLPSYAISRDFDGFAIERFLGSREHMPFCIPNGHCLLGLSCGKLGRHGFYVTSCLIGRG